MDLSLFTTTQQPLRQNAVYTGEIWTSPAPDMHLSTLQKPFLQHLYWNRYLLVAQLQIRDGSKSSRQLVLRLPEMDIFLENAIGLQSYAEQFVRGVFSLFWSPSTSAHLQGRLTALWNVSPVEYTGLARKQGLDDVLFSAQHSATLHHDLGVFEVGLDSEPYLPDEELRNLTQPDLGLLRVIHGIIWSV